MHIQHKVVIFFKGVNLFQVCVCKGEQLNTPSNPRQRAAGPLGQTCGPGTLGTMPSGGAYEKLWSVGLFHLSYGVSSRGLSPLRTLSCCPMQYLYWLPGRGPHNIATIQMLLCIRNDALLCASVPSAYADTLYFFYFFPSFFFFTIIKIWQMTETGFYSWCCVA